MRTANRFRFGLYVGGTAAYPIPAGVRGFEFDTSPEFANNSIQNFSATDAEHPPAAGQWRADIQAAGRMTI